MESYYRIFKNIYKTYTKCIVSIYKFLIGMDNHVKEMLDKILNEYDDVVSKGSHDIGNCTQVKHDIRLNDERPIKRKQSPRSAKENEWIKGQIDEMLKNNS